MTDYVKIDDFVKEIADEPWSLYWSEMKSESDEFIEFMKNPLPVLQRSFPQVDSTWHIDTEIVNHQKGLLLTAVCQAAFIFDEIKLVKIIMYKH